MSEATVAYNEIQKLCTEFVNDPDTTVGMECNWHDYLIKEVTFADNFGQENTIQAVPVTHEKYGDMDVYITFRDQNMIISTKDWLLK